MITNGRSILCTVVTATISNHNVMLIAQHIPLTLRTIGITKCQDGYRYRVTGCRTFMASVVGPEFVSLLLLI